MQGNCRSLGLCTPCGGTLKYKTTTENAISPSYRLVSSKSCIPRVNIRAENRYHIDQNSVPESDPPLSRDLD